MKLTIYFARESGAALITSLIFLTILTILGMSTMGTALLESRMAGNGRDRTLAFQAAEMGLRDAELFIRDSGRIAGNILVELGSDSTDTGQACSYGFCYNGANWNATGADWIALPVWTNETYWQTAIQYQRSGATTGKGIGYAGSTQVAFSAPYSLPTALPLVQRQPEYLIESFKRKPGNNYDYYRITVRGYGMRSGTRVMLQEVYTPSS